MPIRAENSMRQVRIRLKNGSHARFVPSTVSNDAWLRVTRRSSSAAATVRVVVRSCRHHGDNDRSKLHPSDSYLVGNTSPAPDSDHVGSGALQNVVNGAESGRVASRESLLRAMDCPWTSS